MGLIAKLEAFANAVKELPADKYVSASPEKNKEVQALAQKIIHEVLYLDEFDSVSSDQRKAIHTYRNQIRDRFSLLKANGVFDRLLRTSKTENAISSVLIELDYSFPSVDSSKPIVPTAPEASMIPSTTVKATFNLAVFYDTGYGNCLEMRGNGPGMSWDVGLPFRCEDGDYWTIDIPISDKPYEYKIVMKKADGELVWEYLPYGGNRTYEAGKTYIPSFSPVMAPPPPKPKSGNLQVQDDSLSDKVKTNIFDFVREHLLGDDGKLITASSSDMAGKLVALSKTYKPLDPSYAGVVNEYHMAHGHGERTLNRLHEVLKNPALEAARLGLDPANTAQMYAARMFMKAVIRNPSASLEEIQAFYVKKMTGSKADLGTYPLLAKHRVLGEKALCDLPARPSPVDILMANTRILYSPKADPSGHIRKSFSELLSHPETAHIIYALAMLIQQLKGNIFINDSSDLLGDIARHRGAQGYYGYVYAHSIYLRKLDSVEGYLTFKSLFIHEASHYIFHQLVANDYSPVSGDQEAILDVALEKDRAHRKNTPDFSSSPSSYFLLDSRYKNIYRSLVTRLEENPGYFSPSGFDPNNPKHLHVMRVEAIVRIMEQIADGASLEDIRAVAPHLCDFYFRYSKPMIEQHILSGLSALTGIAPSDVIKGTHSTELTAVYDTGYGNSLEIRGNGPGMSWDVGIPLSCTGADRWSSSITSSEKPFEYKIVMRTAAGEVIWEDLELNRIFEPGKPLHLNPVFKRDEAHVGA